MTKLRVIEGPDAGTVVDLAGPVVIGRDRGCALRLSDDQISRQHARITPEDGGTLLEDLGSTNGTFVDGALVTAPLRLSPGSRVRVGETVIEHVVPLAATAVRTLASAFEQQTRERPIPPPPVDAAAPPAPAAPAPAAAPVPAPRAWNGIEVYGLIREFKSGFRAVNELYLQVHPGEIYGFLGPNGAGKSTTVHLLTTLLRPSGGVAHVAGYDVTANPAEVRAAIGVALQEASLDPLLNAHEHMQLQCSMQGLPRREWKARGDELIERVSLTEAADRPAGGYSGGMKRRLDLALALVHRPRILFLDEPTTGLDPKSRGDLWDEVARLKNQEGVTVFLTTQYLEEADQLADRVGIINHGQLVTEGTPAELKAKIGRPTAEVTPVDPDQTPAIRAVLERFGELVASTKGAAAQLRDGAEALPDVVRAIDQVGIRVANIELHQPTLDDVFLKETGRSLEDQALVQRGGNEIAPAPQPVAQRGASR